MSCLGDRGNRCGVLFWESLTGQVFDLTELADKLLEHQLAKAAAAEAADAVDRCGAASSGVNTLIMKNKSKAATMAMASAAATKFRKASLAFPYLSVRPVIFLHFIMH